MATRCDLLFEHPSEDTLRVILSGPWKLGKDLPSADVVMQKAKGAAAVRDIGLDAQGLADWDTGLLIFLADIWKCCAKENIRLTSTGLPPGVKNLLELATAVPEKKDARKAEGRVSLMLKTGR